MKEEYVIPDMEFVYFESYDIITTSYGDEYVEEDDGENDGEWT